MESKVMRERLLWFLYKTVHFLIIVNNATICNILWNSRNYDSSLLLFWQKIFINEFVLTQSGFLVECEDISMQY